MLDKLTVEQRKALLEKYPYLMPRNAFTGEPVKNYDYSFIEGEYDLPEGWLQLFLQCCEDIYEPLARADRLDKFRFAQVKEKYGRMVLYTSGSTEEVLTILDKYEFLSEQVCSECGIPATIRTFGYICPYCSECVRGSIENVDEREWIEIKTSYLLERRENGVTTQKVVDCTDEWTRYLDRIGYTVKKVE